nr:hypothetical protein [Clavibacter michiganensis]
MSARPTRLYDRSSGAPVTHAAGAEHQENVREVVSRAVSAQSPLTAARRYTFVIVTGEASSARSRPTSTVAECAWSAANAQVEAMHAPTTPMTMTLR